MTRRNAAALSPSVRVASGGSSVVLAPSVHGLGGTESVDEFGHPPARVRRSRKGLEELPFDVALPRWGQLRCPFGEFFQFVVGQRGDNSGLLLPVHGFPPFDVLAKCQFVDEPAAGDHATAELRCQSAGLPVRDVQAGSCFGERHSRVFVHGVRLRQLGLVDDRLAADGHFVLAVEFFMARNTSGLVSIWVRAVDAARINQFARVAVSRMTSEQHGFRSRRRTCGPWPNRALCVRDPTARCCRRSPHLDAAVDQNAHPCQLPSQRPAPWPEPRRAGSGVRSACGS